MSKKKTREQKIKSSMRESRSGISYTLSKDIIRDDKKTDTRSNNNQYTSDIKKILIASAAIFLFDLALYVVLSNGIITLGILGY